MTNLLHGSQTILCSRRILFDDNADNVRHWLCQFHLVDRMGGESDGDKKLRLEWLKLASHDCEDPKNDPVIFKQFAELFPILHHRLQLNVNPNIMDSLLDEQTFSVKRRVNNPQDTSKKTEDKMWWEFNILAPLRRLVREVGERPRMKNGKDKKAKWSQTHSQ